MAILFLENGVQLTDTSEINKAIAVLGAKLAVWPVGSNSALKTTAEQANP